MIGFTDIFKTLFENSVSIGIDRRRRIVLFLILCIVMVLFGLGYYQFESNRIKKIKLREIAAIGELKAKEIQHWRSERLSDARSLSNSSFVRKAVLGLLANKTDTNLIKEIVERFENKENERKNVSILLIDTLENIVISSEKHIAEIFPATKRALTQSSMTGKPIFSNLYLGPNQNVIFDIVTPIISFQQKNVAYIIIRYHASTYLYPLIESWPIPSKSSETVLAMREGDSVVFLNNLKFVPNSALRLKTTINRTDVPAVQAVLGRVGTFNGKDYRGVAVIADVRPVPDSPWIIVSKIDKSEGLKELRYRVFVIILFVCAFIGSSIFFFYSTIKRNQAELYKQMFHHEQDSNLLISISEEKFRTLFENITEGVALHEMVNNESGEAIDYRVIDVNPAFTHHTGLSREMALGKLGTELYQTTPPPFFDEYYGVAKTRNPYHFETFFPPMQKQFMISAISPRIGQFATVFEDITERKRIEDELRKKNEELARFIYTVSHDLKSPLVTIKSFTTYLKEDIQSDNKEAIAKDMGYINNAADKMAMLLDELLELSRVGRKGNPKTEIAFQDVVKSALDLVAGRISDNKVNITVSEQPIILFGDPQRLIQLFQNLIDNSVKFMGTQKNPAIEIGTVTRNNEILLFVRDNGSGIDPRYSHKLFGLFEKLDTSSNGTGIGLALVKRIVETHKGTIWFESDGPEKGTIFYFKLDKTRIKNL
jgi:signal transduction histidine kinase